jgi:hypothetical protein
MNLFLVKISKNGFEFFVSLTTLYFSSFAPTQFPVLNSTRECHVYCCVFLISLAKQSSNSGYSRVDLIAQHIFKLKTTHNHHINCIQQPTLDVDISWLYRSKNKITQDDCLR